MVQLAAAFEARDVGALADGAAAEMVLSRLLTRRERPEDSIQALARQPDDIKVVVQFGDA